jgi:hypothetical protein
MATQKHKVCSMWLFHFLEISANMLLDWVNKSSLNNITELEFNIVLKCGHNMPYLLPTSTSLHKL